MRRAVLSLTGAPGGSGVFGGGETATVRPPPWCACTRPLRNCMAGSFFFFLSFAFFLVRFVLFCFGVFGGGIRFVTTAREIGWLAQIGFRKSLVGVFAHSCASPSERCTPHSAVRAHGMRIIFHAFGAGSPSQRRAESSARALIDSSNRYVSIADRLQPMSVPIGHQVAKIFPREKLRYRGDWQLSADQAFS